MEAEVSTRTEPARKGGGVLPAFFTLSVLLVSLKVCEFGASTQWQFARELFGVIQQGVFRPDWTNWIGLPISVFEGVATAAGIAAVFVSATVLRHTTVTTVIHNLDKIERLQSEVEAVQLELEAKHRELRRSEEELTSNRERSQMMRAQLQRDRQLFDEIKEKLKSVVQKITDPNAGEEEVREALKSAVREIRGSE